MAVVTTIFNRLISAFDCVKLLMLIVSSFFLLGNGSDGANDQEEIQLNSDAAKTVNMRSGHDFALPVCISFQSSPYFVMKLWCLNLFLIKIHSDFWMREESVAISARPRRKCWMSISTRTSATPTPVRRPRRSWRESATSQWHKSAIGLETSGFGTRRISERPRRKLIYTRPGRRCKDKVSFFVASFRSYWIIKYFFRWFPGLNLRDSAVGCLVFDEQLCCRLFVSSNDWLIGGMSLLFVVVWSIDRSIDWLIGVMGLFNVFGFKIFRRWSSKLFRSNSGLRKPGELSASAIFSVLGRLRLCRNAQSFAQSQHRRWTQLSQTQLQREWSHDSQRCLVRSGFSCTRECLSWERHQQRGWYWWGNGLESSRHQAASSSISSFHFFFVLVVT